MSRIAYVLPASFGQERLWLLDQLQPGSPLYNLSGGVRLTGELDQELLRRCLREIAERHEVLRTALRLEGPDVVQEVLESVDLSPQPVDLAEESADLETVIRRLDAVPFDLAQAPLVRCHLIRSAPDEHVLLMVMHHAIGDGRSIEVLLAELAALYGAHLNGTEPLIPELPLQYADFVAWQREVLESGALEEQLDHWERELAGAEPLRLPSDRPRPARPSHIAEVARTRLAAETLNRLSSLGSGATAFMVAAAGYAALLSRWSGQRDVVLGFPSLGRDQAELLDLVGFFVNTVPMRIDLSGDPSFADLLQRVRGRSLAANANSAVPFEKLVERLRPERVADRTPLAQAWIVLQQPHHTLPMGDLVAEPVILPLSHLPFEVALSLRHEENGDLSAVFAAPSDVFTTQTVRQAAQTWAELLTAAAANPATPLSELPFLISPAGRAEQPEPQAAVATAAIEAAEGGERPSSRTELLLAQLWAEVLGQEEVPVDQDFYKLGGNSLRAVRIVTRARELGLELPVEKVLGGHTIRQLAADVESNPST